MLSLGMIITLSLLHLIAQDFRITSFSKQGSDFLLAYESDTNFYYIVYSGSNVTEIISPLEVEAGRVGEGVFTNRSMNGTQEFFNVLRVPASDHRDYDGDGMDDLYELGFSELDPLDASDVTLDQDDDGFGAIYEYIHGADPEDAASVPVATLYVQADALPGGNGSAPAPFATIQAALDAARDFDIIQLADGIYTGAGNKELRYRRKPVMLRSEQGPENCVIDCEGAGRGFFFSGEDQLSVLHGVTVRNGYQTSWGGGIYCLSAAPTIQYCRIVANESEVTGGGVACVYGGPAFRNCEFHENRAISGGAIRLFTSTPTLANCVIAKNSAREYGAGYYGDTRSDSLFQHCTIVDNHAIDEGGAGYGWSGNTTIRNCIVWRNTPQPFSGNSLPDITYFPGGGGMDR